MHSTKPPRDVGQVSGQVLGQVSRSNENLAVAATELAWAVALATTRTAVASAARGFELWSQMLRGQAVSSPWSLHANLLNANPAGWHRDAPSVSAPGTPAHPALAPSAPAAHEPPTGTVPDEAQAFASYRSSSGHAAAQVSRRD